MHFCYNMYAMAKRKSVMLTEPEYRVLNEARRYFWEATRAEISFGAFITMLSFGVLATKSAEEVGISCPKCGWKAKLSLVRRREGASP
jgi:hypothetical protein